MRWVKRCSPVFKVVGQHRSSHQRCSIKKVFMKTSQNSQESTSTWVSLQASAKQLYLKKRLWHRYFPLKFAKFLRIPFLQNTSCGCFSQERYWRNSPSLDFFPLDFAKFHQSIIFQNTFCWHFKSKRNLGKIS